MDYNRYTKYKLDLGPNASFDSNMLFMIDDELNSNFEIEIEEIGTKKSVCVNDYIIIVPVGATRLIKIITLDKTFAFFVKADGTLPDHAVGYAVNKPEYWIEFE